MEHASQDNVSMVSDEVDAQERPRSPNVLGATNQETQGSHVHDTSSYRRGEWRLDHAMTGTSELECPAKATRREWFGLAVIALPCMLYSMDRTVLHLALPRISAELQPTSSQLLWMVDIYGFVLAGFLVSMGTLGDRIGRRRLLLIGATAFGAASLLAAFSSNTAMLITARALLGMASASFAPSTLALIRDMFLDTGQRTFAIGIWATSHSVGGSIGPLVAGVLLPHFGWGSVFLVVLPFMALLLVAGPTLLPESKNPTAGRIDLTSAFQSLVTVLLVIYGIKQIAAYGPQLSAVCAIGMGAALGVAFVHRQRRLEHPLLDLRLLRGSSFATTLLVYMLGCFVASGVGLFSAQYVQLVLGLPPLQAGLWGLPSTFAFIIGSMLTPIIRCRIATIPTVSAGLILTAVGLMVIAQVNESSDIKLLVSGFFIFCLGLAPVLNLAVGLLVETAPREQAGAVTSIAETSSELGSALGVAILGSVGTAIYRSALESSMLAGIATEAVETARETLGGAVTTAQLLPESLGAPLLIAARAAFGTAFNLVTMLSAAILVGLAVIVVILLWAEPFAWRVQLDKHASKVVSNAAESTFDK